MAETPATELLIDSARNDLMRVKSRDGEKIGTIHSFIINKRTGRAHYAVLTIGGFLGVGKAYYPLPFELLSFDPATDGYVVTIDRRQLEGGPSWANNTPDFDQAYADRVRGYYGVTPEVVAV